MGVNDLLDWPKAYIKQTICSTALFNHNVNGLIIENLELMSYLMSVLINVKMEEQFLFRITKKNGLMQDGTFPLY